MPNRQKTCSCGITYTPHRDGQAHCGLCHHSVVQQMWNSSVRTASRRKERAMHEARERRERFAAARIPGRAL